MEGREGSQSARVGRKRERDIKEPETRYGF
jgi:hypothetical protein